MYIVAAKTIIYSGKKIYTRDLNTVRRHLRQARYQLSRYGTRFNKACEVTANTLDNKIVYYKEQLSVDT
jgi:hypothetical protein